MFITIRKLRIKNNPPHIYVKEVDFFMNISDLSGCNLIGLASSLSILIAQDLNEEEIGILSAFFSALGDNLALILASPLSSSKECTKTQKNEQPNCTN
jgi:hypothetical protein